MHCCLCQSSNYMKSAGDAARIAAKKNCCTIALVIEIYVLVCISGIIIDSIDSSPLPNYKCVEFMTQIELKQYHHFFMLN